ncbi:SPOR domain-containing protein [Gracilibacillus dipsosauri]|uniref:SPOR domain-containing protein n=1 Tax=Gracilibacillus dipsosauri TaxID=178340 RepID=UPI00240A1A6C
MRENKGISIQINQPKKKIERKLEAESKLLDEDKPYYNEHVSSPPHYSSMKKRQNGFWKKYRSFIYSSLTAVLIGTFLGFIMLKIFVDIDPEEMAFDQTEQAVSTTKEQTKNATEANTTTSTFEGVPITGYVVQAGVFSSETTAKELLDQLNNASIPSMIWQRDDNYHVFVGVHATTDGSKQFAEEDHLENWEVYAGKEWTTEPVQLSVDTAEAEWVKEFDTILKELITNPTNVTQLEQWLAKSPEELSQALAPLIDKVKAYTAKAEMVDLLKIWYQYVNLSK